MTIREHVKQRIRWAIGVALVSFVLAVVLAVTFGDSGGSPLFLAGLVPFIGAILFMNFGIRCLKCGGNLGITIIHAMPMFGRPKHRVGFCPFCGTSLDEEITRNRK